MSNKYVTETYLDKKLDTMLDEKFSHRFGILVEYMDTRFDQILEVMLGMRQQLDQKADKSEVQEIRDDIKTIKAVVTATNRDLNRINNEW